jgi:hypothetical protein
MDKFERVIEFLAAVEYSTLEHLFHYPAGDENIRVEVSVAEQQILGRREKAGGADQIGADVPMERKAL